MGFSKIVSEKALFLVQGGGLPKAMEWIEQHCDDADFEEELVIVGQEEGSSKPKSNLTKEERAAKAKDLQEKARAARQAREAKMEFENEEMRKRADRELAAAKKIADDQEWSNAIEMRKREKKIFAQ